MEYLNFIFCEFLSLNWPFNIEDKYLFNRRPNSPGDINRQLKRRIVLCFFKAHDRLAAHTYLIGKLFLGQIHQLSVSFQSAYKIRHSLSLAFFRQFPMVIPVQQIFAQKQIESDGQGNGDDVRDESIFQFSHKLSLP